MKYIVRIIGAVIPVAAVFLVILQVIVSNELATLGKHLGQMEQEILLEKDMKQTLETFVASSSSLLVIRERAEGLGFTEPTQKQIMNLLPEVPVAFDLGNRLGNASVE